MPHQPLRTLVTCSDQSFTKESQKKPGSQLLHPSGASRPFAIPMLSLTTQRLTAGLTQALNPQVRLPPAFRPICLELGRLLVASASMKSPTHLWNHRKCSAPVQKLNSLPALCPLRINRARFNNGPFKNNNFKRLTALFM